MKKQLLFIFATIITLNCTAQKAGPAKGLQKVLSLNMPLTVDDDMPGTRGANVAWNPVLKKYYAAFAGNKGYPLAVFDAKGKRQSEDTSVTMIDTRGLWYNPKTKTISGNAYSDYGWFSYKLDAKGNVLDITIDKEGMNQPDAQSVGAFNFNDKKVLFVRSDTLYSYNMNGSFSSTGLIYWGRSEDDEDAEEMYLRENYNFTSLIYTGIKGAEIGFLNTTKKQIELYDQSSLHLTKVLSLPDDATVEPSFNFAYANGIYWLFDMEARTWNGYK